ncbi:MAG: class II fumarate hydratase [Candidatus Ancillula sp.]|jgi:fumarate hydratase class II|nr:class II fumarate hydratase [Candidatus Ancillula sp.]
MQYSDSFGSVEIEDDKFWGINTQRSLDNFRIGTSKMPIEVIHSISYIKRIVAKAALESNVRSARDSADVVLGAIVKVAAEVENGEHDQHFPLVVFQTGSGTQTNMNVNEVIANLANRYISIQEPELFGSSNFCPIDSHDDVNFAQSSNCVFPSAMHISAKKQLEELVIPSLNKLIDALNNLAYSKESEAIKIGRTHMQDAVPMRFRDEVLSWVEMIVVAKNRLIAILPELSKLALFGTAVGTGLNVPKMGTFVDKAQEHLEEDGFTLDANKFFQISSKSTLVAYSSVLKELAVSLTKIGNDIRVYVSGPRAGLSELSIPANEAGSSIMPGKVNPTQIEALTQVCSQVIGNDATITFAASNGHFQLNTFMPVIIYNILQSGRLLGDSVNSFVDNLLSGMHLNTAKMRENVMNSLMLITALTPRIGYDNATKISRHAFENDLTLQEAFTALQGDLGLDLTVEEFREAIDPEHFV